MFRTTFLRQVSLSLLMAFASGSSAFADVVSFKDGTPTPLLGGTYTGAEDTMILTNSGSLANTNFGGRGNMEIGPPNPSNYFRNGLVRFDVTALNGNVSAISAVTLRLTVTNSGALGGGADVIGTNTLQVFQMTAANGDWVEGTGNISVGTGWSTWDQKIHGSQNWAGTPGANTAGVDYVNTLIASFTFNNSTAAGSTIDLVFSDVSFVSNWIAGNNPGLMLRTSNFNSPPNVISLATSESSTLSAHPELIVTFTPVPEPTSMLLGMFGVVLAARKYRIARRT